MTISIRSRLYLHSSLDSLCLVRLQKSPSHTNTSIPYVQTVRPSFCWPLVLMSTDSNAQALSLPGWLALSSIVTVITVIVSFALPILRLKHIPGPWWAACSRAWLVRALASGDAAEKFDEINRKYGELYDGAGLGRYYLLLHCKSCC